MKNIKLYLEDGNELELETCFLNEQFLTDERESFQIFHQRCYTSRGQIGSVPCDDRSYFTKNVGHFWPLLCFGVNFVNQVGCCAHVGHQEWWRRLGDGEGLPPDGRRRVSIKIIAVVERV